jgi:L-fuconolactonase
MVVDSHAHIATADVEKYPTGPVGGHELDPDLVGDPFTVERLIEALDEQGIGHAIVVQRSHIYGFDNRYVSDAVASHSDRLASVVSVGAGEPDVLESIDYWVKERGARGIRLSFPGRLTPGQENDVSWFASEEAIATWQRASDLGIPVCIHFSRGNRAAGVEALGKILRQLVDVSVVVDHLANCAVETGGPDYGMNELDGIDVSNVTFKIVPINFKFLAQANHPTADFVRAAVDRFGAERLMFGSDVTNSIGTHQQLFEAGVASTALLTDQERAEFLGGTAARVYQLS